jgi:hypothetical protein
MWFQHDYKVTESVLQGASSVTSVHPAVPPVAVVSTAFASRLVHYIGSSTSRPPRCQPKWSILLLFLITMAATRPSDFKLAWKISIPHCCQYYLNGHGGHGHGIFFWQQIRRKMKIRRNQSSRTCWLVFKKPWHRIRVKSPLTASAGLNFDEKGQKMVDFIVRWKKNGQKQISASGRNQFCHHTCHDPSNNEYKIPSAILAVH